jgi:hypothetical protein
MYFLSSTMNFYSEITRTLDRILRPDTWVNNAEGVLDTELHLIAAAAENSFLRLHIK